MHTLAVPPCPCALNGEPHDGVVYNSALGAVLRSHARYCQRCGARRRGGGDGRGRGGGGVGGVFAVCTVMHHRARYYV